MRIIFLLRILAVVFLARTATCTTVVVMVTPKGIAVASDSNSGNHGGDFRTTSTVNSEKFVLLKDRYVVASIGLTKVEIPNYDFMEFVKAIEEKSKPTISLDELTELIAGSSAEIWGRFDLLGLNSGYVAPTPTDVSKLLVQYVIAGYSGGVAKINVVQYYIVWEQRKVFGPKIIPLHPSKLSDAYGPYVPYWFGITQALDDLDNKSSFASKRYKALGPAPNTLAGAMQAAARLVGIEEEVNPSTVAGPVRTIGLAPDGAVLRPRIAPVGPLPNAGRAQPRGKK